MESKKAKKSDLRRKSILFFQLGLILVLLLVWQVINWKVTAGEAPEKDFVYMDSFTEEQIPVTKLPQEKLPEIPKPVVEEIEVIENDKEIEESPIASTEADEPALEVADIKVIEEEEKIEDYSFDRVEEVPVFPGCEELKTNAARKSCMNVKISNFVNRTFDTSIGSELGLTGINRIYVSFKIEPDGTVTIIGARGTHPKLEEEAIRVAKKLPEMQPGKQNGKAVGVLYSLPIVFRVQN